MKALVVYGSAFGNTEKIAQAIGGAPDIQWQATATADKGDPHDISQPI